MRSIWPSISVFLTVLSGHKAGAIKKTVRASEQDREDIRQARDAWRKWQKSCDPAKRGCLDETGATTAMVPRYGRSRGGSRCKSDAPGGHWKPMTFIAGLRLDGIVAPWCLDSAMTGLAFKTYLETQLAPTLKPDDIVICDNLAAHKVAGVKEIIEAAGATVIYLPPYSPDLNPIEQAFAKLKTCLRKAMVRSFDALWKTMGKFLNLFKTAAWHNYFTNSGYDLN